MHESMKAPRRWGARTARVALAVLGACVVLAAVALSAASPAAASSALTLGSVSCTGTMRLHYSPGLTNDPSTVTIMIHRSLDSCVSATNPKIIFGKIETTELTAVRSCTDLSAPAPNRTVSVEWADDTTSALAYDADSTYVNGQLVATHDGHVTSGTFAGGRMHADLVLLADDPDGCSTAAGVQTIEGPMVLTILPL